MEKSNIYQKIADIQKEIGKLKKDTQGYNYKYFDINQLLEHLMPLLEKHGLVLTQPIIGGHVTSQINEIDGSDLISSSLPLPEGVKPQDMGSAITYYRRYTLVSLLALQAEDDDGEKASKNRKVVNKEVKDEFIS